MCDAHFSAVAFAVWCLFFNNCISFPSVLWHCLKCQQLLKPEWLWIWISKGPFCHMWSSCIAMECTFTLVNYRSEDNWIKCSKAAFQLHFFLRPTFYQRCHNSYTAQISPFLSRILIKHQAPSFMSWSPPPLIHLHTVRSHCSPKGKRRNR